MKISRVKIHEYLGLTLDFSESGEVKIAMISYIEEMLTFFTKHDYTVKTSLTPVLHH